MNEKQIINKLVMFYIQTIGEVDKDAKINDIIDNLIKYYNCAGFDVKDINDLSKLILGHPYEELLLLQAQ